MPAQTNRRSVNTSRGRPSSTLASTSSDAPGGLNAATSSTDDIPRRRRAIPTEHEDGGTEDDDDDDDDAGVTRQQDVRQLLDEFEKQAHVLTSQVADPTLRTMIGEWTPVKENLSAVMVALRNVAEKKGEAFYLNQARENDASLDRLDSMCKKLIDMQEKVETHRTVITDIRSAISSGNDVTDAGSLYRSGVDERAAAYQAKTQRAKYGSSEAYKKYRTQVWTAIHDDDEPMPSLIDLIPAESEDEEDDGDDIAVLGGSVQDYKCPITLQIMVNPVRSNVCPHAFERSAIYSMLGSAAKPCPAQCTKRLKRSNLVDDPELARACKAYARRLERRRDRIRTQTNATLLD